MIPPDIVEDILRRVSIVDLISQYVPLKKSGQNYKGFCPFHNDKKNPSFSVSDQKGLYHCFSCSASGNSLTFLKEYQKLDFIDAIKILGHLVGVDISLFLENQTNMLPLRNKIKTIHQITQTLFSQNLFNFDNPGTENAVRTLRKRKLDKYSIELFGLGYGGMGQDTLFQFLLEKGFKEDEILESGLCGKTDQGKIYDRFRNRITFPISDNEGTIIAFGGRALDNKTSAKYINSPEHILFKKGSILYAWHLAKEMVSETGHLIIVEGYMDVIRMFQAGFKTTVAPLGTGLTENHLLFIKNKVDTVILCFDGDLAGQKSAYRSSGIAAKNGINTKIVILPENEDPDSFLLHNGPDKLSKIIDESLSSEDFVLDVAKKYLSDTPHFLQNIFEYAIHLEGDQESPALSIATEQFLRKSSELIRASYAAIELEFSRFKEQYFKHKQYSYKLIEKNETSILSAYEENSLELLALLIIFPEFIKHINTILKPEDFPSLETEEFFKTFLLHPEYTSEDWIIRAGNSSFIKKTGKWFDPPDPRIIKNYAVFLKIESLKEKRDSIIRKITQLSQNDKEYYTLGKELVKVQSSLIKLKQDFYRL